MFILNQRFLTVLGIRNGDCLGHAIIHRSRRLFRYDYGNYYPVHLRPVVHVFWPSLRYPIPTVNYGSPFQTLLQYIRVTSRVHSRILHTNGWRRTSVGPATNDTLPWMGRWKTTVPVPHHSYALFVVYAGIRLVVY